MIQVYTDGASAGNPGPAGAGIFIKRSGNPIKVAFPLPEMSNHEAEFHACLIALRRCREEGFLIVSLRTDAKVLVDAVEKRYIKNPLFAPLLKEILEIMDTAFDHVFIKWIPASKNGEADKLAKSAIVRPSGER
ncbi:reverse transcriptase-like protein [Alkalicoccus halolimnae]|uniref:Reverse transcriptase-like protein n=1 Tax=Alkalicoccus halolimnae TaxID=1667239 RepID=A0A5C7F973_9BACI|nr:reverse transcriptase-like protein [Alkalicoccus halolimnae]TXF87261.1 reverse transcriptase-like protein [Alkalicoccus halolimnae]